MKLAVVTGATLRCDKGASPSKLNVTTPFTPQVEGHPVSTIMDNKPIINVKPFGVCAITKSACVPVTPAPWQPGETSVLLPSLFPILSDTSKLPCMVGGMIKITAPGQSIFFVDSFGSEALDSSQYQYLLKLFGGLNNQELLDNLNEANPDEVRVLYDILSAPGGERYVRELLSGAHVRIADNGRLARAWERLSRAYHRPSSHEGTRGAVDGPLVHTVLFGVANHSGHPHTWAQLEGHPGKNPVHVWHPSVPYLPDPHVPYINPGEARDEAQHARDWARYKVTKKNQGPYGSSPHTDSNPIYLPGHPRHNHR